MLAESLLEYEQGFGRWRFLHVQLVERDLLLRERALRRFDQVGDPLRGDAVALDHAVQHAGAVLAVLRKRRHVLALGGHMHATERIEYEMTGGKTRFNQVSAVVGAHVPTTELYGAHAFPDTAPDAAKSPLLELVHGSTGLLDRRPPKG